MSVAAPMTCEFDHLAQNEDFNRYYGTPFQNNWDPNPKPQYNRLRRNEWIHVMLEINKDQDGTTNTRPHRQYFNMEMVENNFAYKDFTAESAPGITILYRVLCGPFLSIGGECSSAFSWVYNNFTPPRNVDINSIYLRRFYYSDSTIDDLFVWINKNGDATSNNMGYEASERMFNLYGRYYKSLDNQLDNGTFTSRDIIFDKPVTVLGASWTAYAEDYLVNDQKIVPIFYNYQTNPPSNMQVTELIDANKYSSNAPCLVYFKSFNQNIEDRNIANNEIVNLFQVTDLFGNDGYSPIHLQGKQLITRKLRYNVKFRTGITSILEATLMAAPIFDDITIFYTQGKPTILSYIIS